MPLYIAEAGAYYSTSKAATWSARFAAYKALGAVGLRVSINWTDFSVVAGGWRPYPYAQFMQAAILAGLNLKLVVSCYGNTPSWYFANNPANQLVDTLGSCGRVMSPWSPDTRPTLLAATQQAFASIGQLGFFPYVSELVVDCGLAAEPIYPAPGYIGKSAVGTWWCDPYAVAANPGPAEQAEWYRDSKRAMTLSQVKNYASLRDEYAPHAGLVILCPGTHISAAEFAAGVMDYNMNICTDSEFLLSLAEVYGAAVQIDSAPQPAETAYLRSLAPGLTWEAENAGSKANDPASILADVKPWAASLDYVSAANLFNADGVTVNSTYAALKAAMTLT